MPTTQENLDRTKKKARVGTKSRPNYDKAANESLRKKIARKKKVDKAVNKKLDAKPNVGKADASGFRKYTGKKGQVVKGSETKRVVPAGESASLKETTARKGDSKVVAQKKVNKGKVVKKQEANKAVALSGVKPKTTSIAKSVNRPKAKAVGTGKSAGVVSDTSVKTAKVNSGDIKKAKSDIDAKPKKKAFRGSTRSEKRKAKAYDLDAKAERKRASDKGITEKKYNRLKNRAQRKRERAAGDRRGAFATAAHKVGRAVATVAAASGGEGRGFKKGGTKGSAWKTEAGLTKQGQAKKNALKKRNKK